MLGIQMLELVLEVGMVVGKFNQLEPHIRFEWAVLLAEAWEQALAWVQVLDMQNIMAQELGMVGYM